MTDVNVAAMRAALETLCRIAQFPLAVELDVDDYAADYEVCEVLIVGSDKRPWLYLDPMVMGQGKAIVTILNGAAALLDRVGQAEGHAARLEALLASVRGIAIVVEGQDYA